MRWRPAATGLAAGLIVLPLLTFSPLAASETVLAQSAPSQLQAPRPPGKRKLGVSNQVQTYLHPVRKFTLAIPPGMEVFERGETVQVSIRSRQGYKINVQTGDATLLLIDGAIEHLPAALAGTLADGGRVVTGLVDRGVTRLATGRKVAGSLGLLPLAETGIPRLGQFDKPTGWTF